MRILKILLVLSAWGWHTPTFAQEFVHVALGQIVEHQALDILRTSLKEGLEGHGYKEGVNLTWTYENAQGNPSTAVQIARKLVSLQPTVIVTLSTPMTQALASTTQSIPLLFGAVTDPTAAKLSHRPNVGGLTDFVSPEKQLELISMMTPDAKTIGLIFNSGEANSRKQAEALKALAHKKKIRVIEATVSKTSDVPSAAKSLVGRVDVIFLPTDNTVIAALDSILSIASHNRIPVLGSDVDIVRRGATAAYGVDWRESGLTLSTLVAHVLKNSSSPPLSIQHPQNLFLYINATAAKNMGLDISNEVLKKANKVF